MYIPTQRFLREPTAQPSWPLVLPVDASPDYEPYDLDTRSTEIPTEQDTSFNVPSAFIGVSVAALVFTLLVIA